MELVVRGPSEAGELSSTHFSRTTLSRENGVLHVEGMLATARLAELDGIIADFIARMTTSSAPSPAVTAKAPMWSGPSSRGATKSARERFGRPSPWSPCWRSIGNRVPSSIREQARAAEGKSSLAEAA